MRYRCEIGDKVFEASSIRELGRELENSTELLEGRVVDVTEGRSNNPFCKMMLWEDKIYRLVDYKDRVLKHASEPIPMIRRV